MQRTNLRVEWQPPIRDTAGDAFAASYEVEVNLENTGIWTRRTTTSLATEFLDITEGIYRARVRAVNFQGKPSAWAEVAPISWEGSFNYGFNLTEISSSFVMSGVL